MKKTQEKTFVDFINKKTYRVPKSKETLLGVYQNRYAIILAVCVLLEGFIFGLWPTLFFALVTVVFTEYVYRSRFLKSLTVIPTETVTKKEINKQATIMNCLLYLALGIGLIYYALGEPHPDTQKILLLAIGAGTLGVGITYVTKLFTKNA
ncbi:hypothetical protein G7062_02645 [Erysipelothrix sp. HDW6C]|uniref:hypothetical protein n=1 Tax=Erysipelothrix sp. HDW6C TaxID=2714930 RepID=UPI0014090EE7|nr:hypothetical protein [Erysipelothrix sp. HDW6C]QIK69253.1 hypothetical protein G7062_02645 [Erysipelothrix sp. HDW6C]